jgi:hypothetical protein
MGSKFGKPTAEPLAENTDGASDNGNFSLEFKETSIV